MIMRIVVSFIFLAFISIAQAQLSGGLMFPGPGAGSSAVSPIGTPTSIGSTVSASANSTTCVITTTAAIVAGNLVVVGIQIPSNALRTVSSVSDGTNSYSLAVAINDGSFFF